MPYRRSYQRKRNYRRKSAPWYTKKYNAKQVAQAAWRGVNYLKGLVNSELYKLDHAASGQNVPNTGLVVNLTDIAQGDGALNRTGNSIFLRSVNGRGALTINLTAATPQVFRLALVLDTQQIGDTLPTAANIYEASGPFSHLNQNTVGRFKVLWTNTYTVNTDKPQVLFDFNKAMRHHVRYNGTADSDIQKGGLYFVATSSQATSNFPTMAYDIRSSYHDN